MKRIAILSGIVAAGVAACSDVTGPPPQFVSMIAPPSHGVDGAPADTVWSTVCYEIEIGGIPATTCERRVVKVYR